MSDSHWLNTLNSEQREAASHNEGPLLILAGAGSGKTTVLVARTGRLIESRIVRPEHLCVMTFTNKAARELKQRVSKKLGSFAEGLWTGTFHSFGLKLLRQYAKPAGLPSHFGIIDQSDSQALVKELLKDLKFPGKDAFDVDQLLSIMGSWRERGQTKAQSDIDYDIVSEWLLPRYTKKLESLGVVDFDGLLLKPLQLMRNSDEIRRRVQGSFQQVMVDEFQDTNVTQMQLIQMLVEPHKNITVVGDDDQAIYGWRGACVSHILDFPNLFKSCRVVRLQMNYRSSPAILQLANSIISKNEQRHDKKLIPHQGGDISELPELFVFENDDQECEGVIREIRTLKDHGFCFKDIAILYRSNSQGALFEVEMRKQQIPYSVTGGTAFFDRREIKDILAYMRCTLSPNEVSLRRVLNVPSRGIGDTSVEALTAHSALHKISFYQTLHQWREAGVQPQTGESIHHFLNLLAALKQRLVGIAASQAAIELTGFIESIGYKKYLESQSKDALAFTKRWNLIQIFAQVFEKHVTKYGSSAKSLGEFINFMELRDTEEEQDDKDQVSLMTLHASKGLEFPAVLLTGIEEDLLPHRTLGGDISEERRLFYVGVTRAKRKLILTRAKQRKRHGRLKPSTVSRFLLEVPDSLIRTYELGWRPVNDSQRRSMLDELYKKLDAMKPAESN